MNLGWEESADAWIQEQGDSGDWTRRKVVDPSLPRFLPPIEGKDVLDCGCGEGRYVRRFNREGARAIGLDASARLLDYARQKSEDRFVRGSALTMPFPDATFDVVFVNIVLVDLPEVGTAAREFARVLRAGGRLVIYDLSPMATCFPNPWVENEGGERLYVKVDQYLKERAHSVSWRGIRIFNYHRPLSVVLKSLLATGLILVDFEEPIPDPDPLDPKIEQYCRVPWVHAMVWRKL